MEISGSKNDWLDENYMAKTEIKKLQNRTTLPSANKRRAVVTESTLNINETK